MTSRTRAALLATSALLLVLAQPVRAFGVTLLAGGPLAWIAVAPMWLALRRLPARDAFRPAFATALAASLGQLFWLYVALHVYGELPALVSFAILFLLASWLALFPAAAIWLARRAESAAVLPLAWAGTEWARGILLSGFPWALLGHSQWRLPVVIQCAELVGVPGLSALLVLVSVAVVELGAARDRRLVAFAAALLVAALGYGALREDAVARDLATRATMRVALAQGNVTQAQKHDETHAGDIRRRYQGELARAEEAHVDLDVWPEAALPAAQHVRSAWLPDTELAAPNRVWMLVGAATWWDEGTTRLAHNSALLVAPGRRIAARYDKQHLVPFGEYVPWPRLLFFLHRLTHGSGSFVPGTSSAPLPIPKAKLGVLICYEDVFPDIARAEAEAGAQVLVVITNDAWYGETSAVWQHASLDAFRAIETRRSIARASQNGVTAWFDATGRLRASLPPFEGPASLIADVPVGGLPSWNLGDLCGAAALAAAIALTRRPGKASDV